MTEKMYYKIIRLKTGETVLFMTPKQSNGFYGEPYTRMIHPLSIAGWSMQAGHILLEPWVDVSDSEEFDVPNDIVLTIGYMRPDIQVKYQHRLQEIQKMFEDIRVRVDTEEKIHELFRDVNMGSFTIIDDNGQEKKY